MSFFDWMDNKAKSKSGYFLYQLFPVIICFVLFAFFMFSTYLFIEKGINPFSENKIQIVLHPTDALVGFFLYFITAIDYALIIGRMQTVNPGTKARFAKEVSWFILPLLIFAGSVMVKLAYEGREYYEQSASIPYPIRKVTSFILNALYYPTRLFTF